MKIEWFPIGKVSNKGAFVPLFVQSLAEHIKKTGLNSEEVMEIGERTINNLRDADDPILLAESSSDLE